MVRRYTYTDGLSGRDLVRLPLEAIRDCSGSGRADDSVAYWCPRVAWLADDAALVAHLRGFGAWDDLDTASTAELRQRTLWTAACDMRESPEFYGIGLKGRADLS